MDTTFDGLLNRRVTIEQPASGYRVAVDTILLAAAIPAHTGETVLDLGCGVGGAMLCLAARVPSVTTVGIDIQENLVEMAKRNIELNAFPGKLVAYGGNATHIPEILWGTFGHVMMNPPYHDGATHDVSADNAKRMANTEQAGELPLWIKSASRALRESGTLTLIHRGDRLDEILDIAREFFKVIEVLPVVPKLGAPPKRVIIRARKTGDNKMMRCVDFVLHKPEGDYTDEAEAILRHAKPLLFTVA